MRIIVGISGASGSIYAKMLLEQLHQTSLQWDALGIVMSENAKDVWKYELGDRAYTNYEDRLYNTQDFTAPFASGSANYDTMIIIPCSMGALGRIATGVSNDLMTRAADVMLKERRKLICVVRETPYSLVHINSMKTITLSGGIILPATPSFYHKPQTVEACVQSIIDRAFQIMGIQTERYQWGGNGG